jgi:hypothetical protein
MSLCHTITPFIFHCPFIVFDLSLNISGPGPSWLCVSSKVFVLRMLARRQLSTIHLCSRSKHLSSSLVFHQAPGVMDRADSVPARKPFFCRCWLCASYTFLFALFQPSIAPILLCLVCSEAQRILCRISVSLLQVCVILPLLSLFHCIFSQICH